MVAVFTLLLAPVVASASEPCQRGCACSQYAPRVTMYPNGSVLVPTNARVLVPTLDGIAPRVALFADGAPDVSLPVRVEPVADADAVFVTPAAALAPSTRFRLEGRWEHVAGGAPFRLDFLTAEGADREAPSVLSATAAPVDDGELCDAFVGTRVTIETDDGLGEISLLRVAVELEGGDVHVLYGVPFASAYRTLVLGSGGEICDADSRERPTLPAVAAGTIARITVTAIDAAGNASAPFVLEDVALTASAAGDSRFYGACWGCNAPGVPGEGGALAALALALFVVARARRR